MIAECSCQHCGGHIEFEAEQSGAVVGCPHCGNEMTLVIKSQQQPASKSGVPTKPLPQKSIAPAGPKISRFGWMGIGLAVAVLMVIGLGFLGGNITPEKTSVHSQTTAFGLEIISNSLVCPTTAKFSGAHCEMRGGEYFVSGKVDSQNRFGAMVRDDFTCIITNDGTKMIWVGSTIGDSIQMNPDFKYEPVKILSSEDHVWRDDGYDFKSVKGVVKNISKDEITSVTIIYDLSIGNSKISGQAHSYINGAIEPGQTTNFETDYFDPKETAYFNSVTAY